MYRNTVESREQLLATVNMKVKQNFRENGLRENEKEKEKEKNGKKVQAIAICIECF